jgi:hypothetical protein
MERFDSSQLQCKEKDMALPVILIPAVVAALGIGAKKAVDGYQTHSEANDIVERTKQRYSSAKSDFDRLERKTQEALTDLGNLELEIGQRFEEFQKIADELLEKFNQGRQDKLSITLPQHRLQKIEALKFTAKGVLGSIAGGSMAGAAAGFAVYGGVMTFAAASTGTAIASLSGVAATNAALAAIGGGSLATGGLGMAGGTAILGATVAAPVLAILAWSYASHGEDALINARKARDEADKAIEKLGRASHFHRRMQEYVGKVHATLKDIYPEFQGYLGMLRDMALLLQSASNLTQDKEALGKLTKSISDDALIRIQNGYMLAAILTDVITTPLFKLKQENGEVVKDPKTGIPAIAEDSDGLAIVNDADLDKALVNSREESAKVNKVA